LDWQRAKWGKFASFIIKLGERAAVRYSHEIGVVSIGLQHYFQNTYNRRTTYVSNAPSSYLGSDPNFFTGEAYGLTQGCYLLFLGRLVPEKRPDLLIRAFQRLLPTNWKLVFVGGTSDTSKYFRQLQSLVNLNSNIVFTGELRGAQLAAIVRGAGLFVLPSEVEGLPLALLEAMREGVPAVASDIPVHRQILGSNRGLLFKEGDLDDCIKILDWAIQNSDPMKKMADKAKQYVQQNHNWDRIAEDWLAVYEKLLGISAFTKTPAKL
jgi:glycosyltransferase involved in cell wall biosynthesis